MIATVSLHDNMSQFLINLFTQISLSIQLPNIYLYLYTQIFMYFWKLLLIWRSISNTDLKIVFELNGVEFFS